MFARVHEPFIERRMDALLCLRSHPAACCPVRFREVRERGVCRVGKFVALGSVVADCRLGRGFAGHRGLDWRARLCGRAIVVIRPPERPSGLSRADAEGIGTTTDCKSRFAPALLS